MHITLQYANALFKQENIHQFKCGLKLLLPPYYTVGAAAIFINSSVALKLLLPLCWRGVPPRPSMLVNIKLDRGGAIKNERDGG
jgi:hypothetical protein